MLNELPQVTADDMKALTNRQLLKEYRTDKQQLIELQQLKARGSKTYLGDSLFRHLFQVKRSLALAENELKARKYNIETLTKSRPGKPKTNEQLITALLKDMHTMEAAILRERIQAISTITRGHIKRKPSDFDNPLFHHTHYLAVCDKIDKHLSAQD